MDYGWICVMMLAFAKETITVQSFIEEPKSQNATINSTIILKCVVQDKAGQIQWSKDGFAMGAERDYSGYSRYSVIGGKNRNTVEFSLKIDDVQLEDDGTYACNCLRTPKDPFIRSAPAYLTVLVPPDPPVITNGNTIRVTLSIPTNISCSSANGKPGAEISFYKNGVYLRNNKVSRTEQNSDTDKREKTTSHVTIIPTVEDHGRRIECTATNVVLTQPLRTVATLDVQYAPKIRMSVNVTRKLREHDFVRFTCDANANPDTVTWKWYLDGQLTDKNKEYFDIPYIRRDLHRSLLKCVGSNNIGLSEKSVALNIEYGPQIENSQSIVGVEIGQTVTLTCDVDGNPTPSIIWRRSNFPDALSTDNQYTVRVQEHSLGMYICTASSIDAGFAPVSTKKYLVMKDKPKIMSNEKQYAAKGSTADLECKAWSVPKADEVTWFYNHKEIDFTSSVRYSFSAVNNPASVLNTLHIQNVKDTDFGVYNCTVLNSKGIDFLEITLIKKEFLSLSYIIGGVIVGVAVIFIIAIACVLYPRHKRSNNETIGAETDSNTEIEKPEKTADSPIEFQKGTLMEQRRQDLNYHCPTDVYGKKNGTKSKVTSGYGKLRPENYTNGYNNHNRQLFSDYIQRSDEAIPSESQMGNGFSQYGTITYRSRPDHPKSVYPDQYQLPPADISTTKLATNV